MVDLVVVEKELAQLETIQLVDRQLQIKVLLVDLALENLVVEVQQVEVVVLLNLETLTNLHLPILVELEEMV